MAPVNSGIIYVLGESPRGPVKIGYGDKPSKRLRELQVGNPRELFLYHQEPCTSASTIEAWLHQNLRTCHRRGEWFDTTVARVVRLITLALARERDKKLGYVSRSKNMRLRRGVPQRRCSRCLRWKALSAFAPSHKRRIGYQGRCKPCARQCNNDYFRKPEVRLRHNARQRAYKQRLRERRMSTLTPG